MFVTTVPLSDSEKTVLYNEFKSNIDNLTHVSPTGEKYTFIPDSAKNKLLNDYKASFELPEIYSKMDNLIEKAPERGISDKDLETLKTTAQSNKLLNEWNPKTNQTYANDILTQVQQVKEGYITPAQFKESNPFGFLTTLSNQERVEKQERKMGFALPTINTVTSAAVYGGYDAYKGLVGIRSSARSLIGFKPDTTDTTQLPEFTKDTPTIGQQLDKGNVGISRILYTPLTKEGVSIGKTYEKGVDVVAGVGSYIPTIASKGLIEPFLSPDQKQRLNVVGGTIRDFGKGLAMSPVEKPVETVASVGVGKIFATGLPILESWATRLIAGGAAKVGMRGALTQRAVVAITRYAVMGGIGVPYAFSVGERVITSERPGYEL